MYDTGGSYSVCYAAPTDDNLAPRLNWLKGELERRELPRKTPRRVADEWRALRSVTVGNAFTTGEAYAWFGTFLGLFPPLALFTRMLWAAYSGRASVDNAILFWGLLLLLMNAVCCLVGRKMGGFVGRKFGDPRARSLPVLLLCSLLMAVVWGVITGAAGGAVGFLVGAVFGVACAVPVAVAAFPVFALLHHALSRGGMIEEQRLWPLAFGVPLTAAALILSPWIK
jgi:hypothetical protein